MIASTAQHVPGIKPCKVRLLQRKLYRVAKDDSDRRFGVLYDKVCRPDVLEAAWKMVRANRGAAGVDRQSFDDIEATGVDRFLKSIREELTQEIYRPRPVLRRFISKGNGKLRPLGIPTIKDRVIQMAVKLVIEPLFEADFQEFSYGFRPKRSAHQAITEVRKYINFGCQEIIEVDLKSFFDNIPHDKLMALVRLRITDPKVLRLLELWLKVGVVSETGHTRSLIGTPQGGVISPLLANIFLNELDRQWRERRYDHPSKDAHLIRYCDDMVIVCKWRPKWYFERLKEILGELGVAINEEKTQVVHASEGFDFLGIHFLLRPSLKGRMNCYYWPSHDAVSNFKRMVRQMVNNRATVALPHIIEAVNPTIRGWGQYFVITNAGKVFWNLDRFVCERINCLVRRSRKLRGVKRQVVSGKQLYLDYGLVSLFGMTKGKRPNATR
jgi:RNA-directed DNA polymerase